MTDESTNQRRQAAARHYPNVPLPEAQPILEFTYYKLRITFKEKQGYMIQHAQTSRIGQLYWSPGLPPTDYLLSLWQDLQAARKDNAELRKIIKKLKSKV